jgi:hypothetical protein
MNPYAALVLAVLIVSVAGVIGSVLSARYRAQSGLRKDWMGNEVPIEREDDGSKAALQREVEDLRERVKVLERITTDANSIETRGSRAIADQIESLRDR